MRPCRYVYVREHVVAEVVSKACDMAPYWRAGWPRADADRWTGVESDADSSYSCSRGVDIGGSVGNIRLTMEADT